MNECCDSYDYYSIITAVTVLFSIIFMPSSKLSLTHTHTHTLHVVVYKVYSRDPFQTEVIFFYVYLHFSHKHSGRELIVFNILKNVSLI